MKLQCVSCTLKSRLKLITTDLIAVERDAAGLVRDNGNYRMLDIRASEGGDQNADIDHPRRRYHSQNYQPYACSLFVKYYTVSGLNYQWISALICVWPVDGTRPSTVRSSGHSLSTSTSMDISKKIPKWYTNHSSSSSSNNNNNSNCSRLIKTPGTVKSSNWGRKLANTRYIPFITSIISRK